METFFVAIVSENLYKAIPPKESIECVLTRYNSHANI